MQEEPEELSIEVTVVDDATVRFEPLRKRELTESSPLFETNGINIPSPTYLSLFTDLKIAPYEIQASDPHHLLLAIATCFFGCAEQKEGETKPLNVLYIMADDLAYQAISAYGSPISKLAPTPNLDRIAASGAYGCGVLYQFNMWSEPVVHPDRQIFAPQWLLQKRRRRGL